MGNLCSADKIDSQLHNIEPTPLVNIESIKIPIAEDPISFFLPNIFNKQGSKYVTRQRLILDLLHNANPYRSPNFLLILDSYTAKILGNSLKLYELTERGYGITEFIERKRQPLPNFNAVYFLNSCSKKSINLLLEDFPNNPNSSDGMYGQVYLFFTNSVNDTVINVIKNRKTLFSKLVSLYELNIDYIPSRDLVFITNTNRYCSVNNNVSILRNLYSANIPISYRNEALTTLATQLKTFFVSIGELPYIRYDSTESVGEVAKTLAFKFDTDLTNYLRANPQFEFKENRASFLLLDRSFDPLQPLLHDYSLEALIGDFIGFTDQDGELCRVPGNNESKSELVLLNESDPLWSKLRFEHINDVIAELRQQLEALKNDNDVSKYQMKMNEKSSIDWKLSVAATKAKKEYDEKSAKILKFLNIASKIMEKFKDQTLSEIIEYEQELASGLQNDGKKIDKSNYLAKKLTAFFDNKNIPIIDKVRLIMIYIISQDGIQSESRKHLLTKLESEFDNKDSSTFNELENAVVNLFYLGVTTQTSKSLFSSIFGKDRGYKVNEERINAFLKNITVANERNLATTRYEPLLKQIASHFIEEKLNEEKYPYIIAPPPKQQTSLDNQPYASRILSTLTVPLNIKDADKSNFVIFIAGGITYSEIQCIYQLVAEKGVNLLLGSTHIINPQDYIEELKMKNLEENPCI